MVLHFAHRGSPTEAPENTLPAIQKAINRGAHGIEIDVQLTKDGQLVIWHDLNLARFSDDKPKIKDLTYNEITSLDAGFWFNHSFKGTKLTTLQQILAICPKDVLLNIEIKNPPSPYLGIEEKVAKALLDYQKVETVIISSFDHEALRRMKHLLPNVKIGLLFRDRLWKPWDYVASLDFDVYSIHPDYQILDEKYITHFKELECKIYPFTVDDQSEVNRLVELGVDGVFTNNYTIFEK